MYPLADQSKSDLMFLSSRKLLFSLALIIELAFILELSAKSFITVRGKLFPI
jgi:hypothetical protein